MKKCKEKKKKKKKEDIGNIEYFDYMQGIKDPLKNIIRYDSNKEFQTIIDDLTNRTNKIVCHSYQFLKLYVLHLFDNNKELPKINKEFISDIFKVITTRKSNKGRVAESKMSQQLKELKNFYNDYYSKLVSQEDSIFYDGLSYVLAYEAIDMSSNIETNIQEHFINHLTKYINIMINKKGRVEKIKKIQDTEIRKVKYQDLNKELKDIKDDLINFRNLESPIQYHAWILKTRKNLFHNMNHFENDNVFYQLKSDPQSFLPSMIYLVKQLEKLNKIKKENDIPAIKLFNILPLRKNIVPKSITLDTCSLIQNFMPSNKRAELLRDYKKKDLYDSIWDAVFKLTRKSFRNRKKYKFSHMLKTDGVSSTIMFVRTDDQHEPLHKKWSSTINCTGDGVSYIEKVTNKESLRNKKIVCCDPGMSDLIYCGSYDCIGDLKETNNLGKEKLKTFRYTQSQRNLETRKNKYRDIIKRLNKRTIINNKTVKEWETILSVHNSKTCNFETFKEYCLEKNKLNNQLEEHYRIPLFRKLKSNRFINTQKSENKMIKNFSKKFGNSKETVFILGDWDKENNHMKGSEPTINKRFRRIFKKAGYETYLINEFRTSKLCNGCHCELEKFLEKPRYNKKTRKQEKSLCHGLLRCKSDTHNCGIIHNRDKNAVKNMLNIVNEIIYRNTRPSKFTRSE